VEYVDSLSMSILAASAVAESKCAEILVDICFVFFGNNVRNREGGLATDRAGSGVVEKAG
jgi:hypothetical protein